MKTFNNLLEYATGAIFNIIFIIAAVVVVTFVGSRAYAYGKDLFIKDLNVPYEEFIVEIPPSADNPDRADAMEVGRILEDAGLTKNALVFFVSARLNGLFDKMRPGAYSLNTQMPDRDIMDKLNEADFAPSEDITVAIPEGLNLRQIGEKCESLGIFTAAEFLAVCDEYQRSFYFLNDVPEDRPNMLEGYLFPDTYKLPQNPTPQDLIDRMLNRFSVIFDYQMETRCEELGITIDQAIIMASIIEKEIRVDSERALCSSVIHNRLGRGQKLQMCSTVLYVLDKQKDRLLYSDLEVESPYNTYKYAGLPLGPICGPGKAAIEAVLYPADTDYLYFVLMDEEKGTHYFSTNLGDHEAAKTQYNQQNSINSFDGQS